MRAHPWLADLPVLHRRAFAKEVAEVRRRLPPSTEGVNGLLKLLGRLQRDSHRLRTEAVQFGLWLGNATEQEKRVALAEAVSSRPDFLGRLGDRLAMTLRDFDAEAHAERLIEAADRAGTKLEVGLLILNTAAREGLTGPALGVVCDVVEQERRGPTRIAAIELLAHRGFGDRCHRLLRRLAFQSQTDELERWAAAGAVERVSEGEAVAWCRSFMQHLPDRSLALSRAARALVRRPEGWAMRVLEEVLAAPGELVGFESATEAVTVGGDRGEAVMKLLLSHTSERVRAWTASQAGKGEERLVALLESPLTDEPIVVLGALDAVEEASRGGRRIPGAVGHLVGRLTGHSNQALSRRAAEVLAWQRWTTHPLRAMAEELGSLRPGERSSVRLPLGQTVEALADALLPYAVDGFGFWLDERRGRRIRVTRGDAVVRRTWRALHEVRNPLPAKRQGLSHAVGRGDAGAVFVPPVHLAEQAPTGVPGQRVSLGAMGWGPEIPTVDDCFDALRRGEVLRVTPFGRYGMSRPKSWLKRWMARMRLTWGYASYEQMRNQAVREGTPETWRSTLDGLGFRVERNAGPLAWLLSQSETSLFHLFLATVGMGAAQLAGHAWRRTLIARRRARIPLVIGGWGTRGKSSTERLKAAMLAGSGVHLVSKTTGCEAMVLTSPRGAPLTELMLYRPFDKATIWEQAEVIAFTERQGAMAMLWECMALRPRYVDILQAGWMRDDLSTITNAYPDHEDVQGPTGLDVASTIGRFSAPEGTMFSAEHNMFPVLRERARIQGSTATKIDRARLTLMPQELMDRLPYADHPANVALASRIAEELGIHPVLAIGRMADWVVPDLGALIITSDVPYLNRVVSFANGMSANDLTSFAHNWATADFASHDVCEEPERWLVTVVNNRADRQPRSRVFARILTRNANAHRHVLIGTNLAGLRSMVNEELDLLFKEEPLESDEGWAARSAHLKTVELGSLALATAERLGLDVGPLLAALDGLEPGAPSLAGARKAVAPLRELLERMEKSCGVEGLAHHWFEVAVQQMAVRAGAKADGAARRALYRELVHRSLVAIENSGASGDQIVEAAVLTVPPGCTVRMMGVQNIKGTGLDFAYQWVRWHALSRDLALVAEQPTPENLARLTPGRMTCALHCDGTLAVLEGLESEAASNLAAALVKRRATLVSLRGAKTGGGLVGWLRGVWKRVSNPFAGILRRRRANQIFRDLADRRISHPKAADLLAKLTKAQKA